MSIFDQIVHAVKDVAEVARTDYRQALRDITIQEGFPFTIVWPIQP